MKLIQIAVYGVAACVMIAPAALAQSLVPNGQNGPAVQPKAPIPDIAPPALPGAGDAPGIATAPKVTKVDQGDPTTELFKAINANDYNGAQDAISRGADLTAQNPLGETPLDLSIALNQNSITFLILGARNEDGAPPPAPVQTQAQIHTRTRAHAMPAAMTAPPEVYQAPETTTTEPAPVMGNDPGTPNASAGFLGFGAKN
jgi:hypothetical protein